MAPGAPPSHLPPSRGRTESEGRADATHRTESPPLGRDRRTGRAAGRLRHDGRRVRGRRRTRGRGWAPHEHRGAAHQGRHRDHRRQGRHGLPGEAAAEDRLPGSPLRRHPRRAGHDPHRHQLRGARAPGVPGRGEGGEGPRRARRLPQPRGRGDPLPPARPGDRPGGHPRQARPRTEGRHHLLAGAARILEGQRRLPAGPGRAHRPYGGGRAGREDVPRPPGQGRGGQERQDRADHLRQRRELRRGHPGDRRGRRTLPEDLPLPLEEPGDRRLLQPGGDPRPGRRRPVRGDALLRRPGRQALRQARQEPALVADPGGEERQGHRGRLRGLGQGRGTRSLGVVLDEATAALR